MDSVTIYDRDGRLLAVLDAADQVGYEAKHNDLWTATFSLPSADPQNEYCQMHCLARIPDGGRDTGLYRIFGVQDADDSALGGKKVYQAEHVMATLTDDVLFGKHDLGGMTLRQALAYILARQTTQRWRLGDVEFNVKIAAQPVEEGEEGEDGEADESAQARDASEAQGGGSIGPGTDSGGGSLGPGTEAGEETEITVGILENAPLLNAMMQVSQALGEEYTWDFQCAAPPDMTWTVHLRKADSAPGCGIYYGRSLCGVQCAVDASTMITRLYAQGAENEDGSGPITFAEINGGRPYIDADTAGVWGVKCGVLTDSGIGDPAALLARARQVLEGYKEPYIAYTVRAIDLYRMTGLPWDDYIPGKKVRVLDEAHGIQLDARIVGIAKQDVYGDPGQMEITIANQPRDALDSMSVLQGQAQSLQSQADQTQSQVYYTQKETEKLKDRIIQMAGRVDENTGHWEGVRTQLDGIAQQISLQAGELDEMNELVRGAQIIIDGLKSEIALKADKIDLQGYVTAEALEAEYLKTADLGAAFARLGDVNFSTLDGEYLYSDEINAGTIGCNELTVGGSALAKRSTSLVTGVSINLSRANVQGIPVVENATLDVTTVNLSYWGM